MRVALVTGGSRGIGKGITQALAETGEYEGLLLTYNTNQAAAETFRKELLQIYHGIKKVVIVGGDLADQVTRDGIFETFDTEFSGEDDQLATVVHNAGQYVGLTSDNSAGIEAASKKFGDGSLLVDGKPDFTILQYYNKLYSEAWIDICERSICRMKAARERMQTKFPDQKFRGSIVGISSPGCNTSYKMTPGYDMPGSGKTVMEFSVRQYAAAVADLGVNCNVVIPGFTRSDAWSKIAEQRGIDRDTLIESIAKNVAMPEVIECKDIGDVVAFLSSTGGGRFMTGLSLRVDGGLHLGKPWGSTLSEM